MIVRVLTFVIVSLLPLAWLHGPCSAGPSQQVPIGPRAIGMGGAYSSIADDISAIYWNPAGLARIGHQEITGTHANLYGSGIKDNYVAFLLPLSDRQAVAVDWYHSGFEDEELGFGENRFDLSYGLKLHSRLSVGASLKYLTRDISLDGASVRRGSGQGLDLGLLATPWVGLRVGLMTQDLSGTKIDYSDAGTTVAFPRNVRAAVSYDVGRLATIAFDVDDRYHLGTEVRPIDQVALRAGIEKDRKGSEDPTYAVGAGFEVGIFRIDYAYQIPPVLDPTSHLGLSIAFNFNPSQIRIEKVEADDLFASLYKTYARSPIGNVRIRNLQDRPLSTKITVFVPGAMDAPTEQQVILRPKATQEFPISAVFTEKIMMQADDRPVQVQVTATYQSQRLPRSEKKSAQCVVYGAGAIDWGRGVEQAAAFVTTRDPSIDVLARAAVRSTAVLDPDAFGSRNLRHAAALFDALGVLGVTYVPDPQNPYSAMSETVRAVDTIHYPRETLSKRTGDCDDTSVLMAALLMNVGIPAKLVDVPGHVFVLADAGIHARNSLALGLDETLFAVIDDEVWIPIETTALGKGFAEGWRSGAEEYRTWTTRGRLNLVDVTEAQARYAPSDSPGPPPSFATLDTTRVHEWVSRDGGTIGSWREQYMAERYGEIRETLGSSPEALTQLAHVYFLANQIEASRTKLEQVLRGDPRSAVALNNLGAVHAAAGEIEKAAGRFEAALASDPADAGIWLNLGMARYAMGDSTGALEPLSQGLARSGGYAGACRLLSMQSDEIPARGDPESLSEEETRLLLLEALTRVDAIAAEIDSTEAAPAPGGLATPKPMQTRVAASRAAQRMTIKDHLYWKEWPRR